VNVAEFKSRVWTRLAEDQDNPQRWPSDAVLEYLNDGIQHLVTRTGLKTSSAQITTLDGRVFYNLPADCIRVLSVRDDDSTEYLRPISMWELDRSYFRATDYGAKHAIHYVPFGLDEIGLWPVPEENGRTYSILYSTDPGVSAVSLDTDDIPIPRKYEHILIDYVVARALLPRARGATMEMAVETFKRWQAMEDDMIRRDATLVRTWAR